MNIDNIKIDPEFVDMVYRSVGSEMSIHDTMTQNVAASQAEQMRLHKMMERNEHFIACITRSVLFNMNLDMCFQQVSKLTSPDDKRRMYAIFVAQAILVGIHMHEQLLDKAKKGLI